MEGAHVLFEVDELNLDEPPTEKQGAKPVNHTNFLYIIGVSPS